jgi:hypothetical protein
MRIRPAILITIGVMFAVLFGGRYLGWFGKSPPPASPAPEQPPTQVSVVPEPPAPAPVLPTGGLPPARPAAARPGPAVTGVPAPAIPDPAALAASSTNWEEKIDAVLTGKEDETFKAKKLLEIFPNLPEDGQVEAAQHLSNLLPDEEYPALAQTLTNAHTPESVLDVLMTDVLNRPNQVKLTTLLDVARTPDHPKAEEAKDVLEVFVDEDYGQNWVAWQSAIQKWLKENPDE